MLHSELIDFRKVPRNDILMFLYENGGESNIFEIHERLNQTNKVLYLILSDLIEKSLITVDKYLELRTLNGSFLEGYFSSYSIQLTTKGKDYTESLLFGLNAEKYQNGDPLETLKIIKPNASINYRAFINKSFDAFCDSGLAGRVRMDKYQLFYLLTGRRQKEDKDKKIFISYAHDTEEFTNKWVSKLATELEKHFVVEYDKKLSHKMNPFDYMKHGILSADYVVIVFDQNYKHKYENLTNSGVKFEFSLIEENLFKKIGRSKYLSILKEGNLQTSIPESMQETLYFDFRSENDFALKVKDLISEIKK